MAELNGRRITAVLTTDTAVKLRVSTLTIINSHLHQLADTLLIKLCERILLIDLRIIVAAKELTSIIT